MAKAHPPVLGNAISKAPTGIQGLDEITFGGFPAGRPTLICGSAGCGKTLLAMEFLVRGATEYNEPGVFIAFEETSQELTDNVRSLGFDLAKLSKEKKILLIHVQIERSEIQETGEYDLEGLFIRIEHAIKSIGAKRIVLDTIEALFAGLPNEMILRAELRRLFRWLKEHCMTAVITGERGEKSLTRHGLEEYVADCVISLDHRVTEQISTRRLRVVKYRGTMHGNNEYPFLIDENGISVLPITSLRLDHKASTQRVSSGIPRLDEMLGGKGFFRGSSILVTGSPGTGKSTVAAHFADAACRRGERCLYFAYEESQDQILRNMRSAGVDLEPWIKKGLLHIHATRPTLHGLEMHLVKMHDLVQKIKPKVVVVDPVSNLIGEGQEAELKPTLMRLIDFLKTRQVTALFISLTSGGVSQEESQVGVSSLMDTWLLLRNIEASGERNRTFYILKSRGMGHSNQVREFLITPAGVELVDVRIEGERVLIGSARDAQDARKRADALLHQEDAERKLRQLAGKRSTVEAQIAALKAGLEAEEAETKFLLQQETLRHEMSGADALQNAQSRTRGGARKNRAKTKPAK